MRVKLTRCDVSSSDFETLCSRAEAILAQQIHKDTRPYVPMLTGTFDRNSRVLGNIVEYIGDQAGYLWEGVRMVNSATGAGPRKIPDVGYRWPRYAKLKPTSTPLHYTTDHHPLAGPRWVERSENDNGDKWASVAEEAIADGYNTY